MMILLLSVFYASKAHPTAARPVAKTARTLVDRDIAPLVPVEEELLLPLDEELVEELEVVFELLSLEEVEVCETEGSW